LPVLVVAGDGRKVIVDNLFESSELNAVIWEYFVPVKVNELMYDDLFNEIKNTRRSSYINAFNDDSLKIMDTNGTIIATSGAFTELLNFTNFITRYAINTEFMQLELTNYNNDKNFYSAFYLGSKYIDYSVFMDKNVRSQLLNVADIYLNEAEQLLQNDPDLKEKKALSERLMLTRLLEDLVENNARKVLRQLKKLDTENVISTNKSLLNYIYYTAYRLINDKEEFQKLESDISLVNLRQAQQIVNINR
jgi:hypothetical protein